MEDAGASTGPIVWRTERRCIGDLLEWEKNPRELTEKQAKDLATSLRKFGYVEEIVVNADGHSIIGGHMRRKVALAQALLDPTALVDVRIPSRPLTEDEGIELAIRLNKNSGGWDFDVLANDFDFESLKEWGFEEAELGIFSVAEQDPQAGPGPRSEYRSMSFTLHASQVEIVEQAVARAKEAGLATSSVNENSNGNAIAAVCAEWATQRSSS
jgi:hypothetical protein